MFLNVISYILNVNSHIYKQLRFLSLANRNLQQKALVNNYEKVTAPLTKPSEKNNNNKWAEVQSYNALPGPTRLNLLRNILPGGQYYNLNMIDFNRKLRSKYGDIYRLRGLFGKADTVFTYNPNDIEIVYRNEGVWPWREGLNSFRYYRQNVRPNIFKGLGGVVSEQGKNWYDMRSKINPVLMKVQNVRQNFVQVDLIAQDFIKRIDNLLMHNDSIDLYDELKKWSFESISYVALNRRMGSFSEQPDDKVLQFVDNMEKFFHYAYVYDVLPSIWPYFHTPGFKRYLKVLDNITDTCVDYIEEAKMKFTKNNDAGNSILGKLLKMDEQVALVMVLDMLMAGIDTTSSVTLTLYYLLATNPTKQSRLRQEIFDKLPTTEAQLTHENMQNFPYMRACIKEALRIMPITPCNIRRTTKELILSDYRIPAGTDVLMGVMDLSNCDEYFPLSDTFLPERWLKNDEAYAIRSKNPFVYAPFGFGPRTCIGKRIAELEIEILTARLLRHYAITWDVKEPLKYTCNIITIPSGEIKFKFEKINK